MSDTTIVFIGGEVDLINEDHFDLVLRTHLTDGAGTIVLDLNELTFLSVAGHRVLDAAVADARLHGCSVVVLRSRAVRRVALAAFPDHARAVPA